MLSASRSPTTFLSATYMKTLVLSGQRMPTSEKPRSVSTTLSTSSTFLQWVAWSPGLTHSTRPLGKWPTALSFFHPGSFNFSRRPTEKSLFSTKTTMTSHTLMRPGVGGLLLWVTHTVHAPAGGALHRANPLLAGVNDGLVLR